MLRLLGIIGIILFIGWLLGLFAFHAGGFIYILLVVALIFLIIWLVQQTTRRR